MATKKQPQKSAKKPAAKKPAPKKRYWKTNVYITGYGKVEYGQEVTKEAEDAFLAAQELLTDSSRNDSLTDSSEYITTRDLPAEIEKKREEQRKRRLASN